MLDRPSSTRGRALRSSRRPDRSRRPQGRLRAWRWCRISQVQGGHVFCCAQQTLTSKGKSDGTAMLHESTTRKICSCPKPRCPQVVILGPSWGHLVPVCANLLCHLGAVLGRSWGHLEAILKLSWGHLGAILGYFGYQTQVNLVDLIGLSSWCNLGANLEPFCDHLGAIFAQFGVILAIKIKSTLVGLIGGSPKVTTDSACGGAILE